MTKDEIAAVRGFIEGGRWADGCAYIGRLLKEREHLLEALRPFADGAGTMTYRKMMYEVGLEHVVKQTDAAAGAIRFAEAPLD